MTSRDRVINTLCHQISSPVPTLLTIPQTLEQSRLEVCAQLRTRFQSDLDWVDCAQPVSGTVASGVDEWGCVWESDEEGAWAFSDAPRYDDILELEGIRFPKSPVTVEMAEKVNQICAESSHFVVVQTRVHPFRRLCALGGVEAAKALIQRKPRELREIANRLFEYYMKQLEVWCATDADAIGIEDDLADAMGIRMSVSRWNEIFVPMLHEFCRKIRSADKFVYFTGTGNFEEFIPGLLYAGVDAIRFDADSMDPAILAERYRHRVTFHPVLKSAAIENVPEEELSKKILNLRTIFAENELIAECQMPPRAGMRQIACAMLNWRRRMPQPENF